MSKVGEFYRELAERRLKARVSPMFEEEGPQHPSEMGIEGDIRCKCGKYWGMHNHKRNCKRCKTPVMARGKVGNGK